METLSVLSTDAKRAYAVAKKYDEELKNTDPRFKCAVRILDEDGSAFWFQRAFLMRWNDPELHPGDVDGGEWVFVFTEHQGFRIFPTWELYEYAQYERVLVQYLEYSKTGETENG